MHPQTQFAVPVSPSFQQTTKRLMLSEPADTLTTLYKSRWRAGVIGMIRSR